MLWRERYRVVEAGGVAKWGGGSCIYWSQRYDAVSYTHLTLPTICSV